MSTTVRDAVENLLAYLSPEEQAIPPLQSAGIVRYPGRIEGAVDAVNGALQEVFGKGPLHPARRSFGVLIKAPATVPLALSPDSWIAEISQSDWKQWMLGCTCRIAGQDVDNEILDYSPATGEVTLLYPYAGDVKGSQNTMIWHDSISLDPIAGEIHYASLPGERELYPATSTHDLRDVRSRPEKDYGLSGRSRIYRRREATTSLTGTPSSYFVDSFYRSSEAPERRFKIFPIPEREYTLEYRARVLPPRFVIADVYAETPLPIHNNWIESIFNPVAAQRFQAFSWFRNDSATDEIARQYSVASELLKTGNPQANLPIRLRPGY